VFGLCDLIELVFWAFSVVLCTLREIVKRCCDGDVDRLYFCMFPAGRGPRVGRGRTGVLNSGVLWTYSIVQI